MKRYLSGSQTDETELPGTKQIHDDHKIKRIQEVKRYTRTFTFKSKEDAFDEWLECANQNGSECSDPVR